jgi:hypothetical protein
VAAEAGIPAERVREAARALAPITRTPATPVPTGPAGELPDESPAATRWLGERTAIVFERSVEGEVAEADFGLLVESADAPSRSRGANPSGRDREPG